MLRTLLLLALGLASTAAPAHASNCAGTSTGRIPLNDLGVGFYQGVQGGLYAGGANQRPLAHNAAGVAIANSIGPLDTLGNPSAAGNVVFISIGMSNCTQEFSAFVPKANADPVRKANVRAIDCAMGGQTASILAQPTAAYWDTVFTRLRGRGSSPRQPQVVWLKDANAGPTGGFAVNRDTLAAQFFRILQIIKTKLPSVKLCYMTSRIYAGYASTSLNPEPYAYENGFAVKQVILRQIGGDPGLNYDPAQGAVAAPWVAWGPYVWADGLTPRSDGLTWACSELTTDGTHPSTTGRNKVADSLLAFVRVDETTAPWYAIGPLVAPPPPPSALTLVAWPNPSRDWITFSLPAAASTLRVHDTRGRLVCALTPQGYRARWNLRDREGRRVAPGVYWAEANGARIRLVVRR